MFWLFYIQNIRTFKSISFSDSSFNSNFSAFLLISQSAIVLFQLLLYNLFHFIYSLFIYSSFCKRYNCIVNDMKGVLR